MLEAELYQSFKLDEPWDSPHNKPLLERMPRLFAPPRLPGDATRSLTHFRIFVGDGTPFEDSRGPRWEDFSEGQDRTILIIEADEAVPWTKPEVLPYGSNKPLPPLGGGPGGSSLVLMADGSVRSISAGFDPALLRRAITRNDKQPLDLDRLGTGQPLPTPPGAKPGLDGSRSTTDRPGGRGAGQTGTSRPGDRILLSGRVLDPDGKPSVGVAVYFIRPGARSLGPTSSAPASAGTRGHERARRPVPVPRRPCAVGRCRAAGGGPSADEILATPWSPP